MLVQMHHDYINFTYLQLTRTQLCSKNEHDCVPWNIGVVFLLIFPYTIYKCQYMA
jgi:hypothetical protein